MCCCSYLGEGDGARDSGRLRQILAEHPVRVQALTRLKTEAHQHLPLGSSQGPSLQVSQDQNQQVSTGSSLNIRPRLKTVRVQARLRRTNTFLWVPLKDVAC